MAKISSNQKILRTVRFMLGLRHPGAYGPLREFGLNRETLARGQRLLAEATTPNFDAPSPGEREPKLLFQLDEFENQWFPIVRIVLSQHSPKAHDYVYRKIGMTDGVELVVTVDMWLRRLRELEAGTSPLGRAGKAVFHLLGTRGLSPSVMARGEALIGRVAEFEGERQLPFTIAPYDETVDALWRWYLEWSGIARVIIKDRNVLRGLGFLRSRAGSDVAGNGTAGNGTAGNGTAEDETSEPDVEDGVEAPGQR